MSAPTGSGKTLAAFLWALDRLVADPERGRLVYVSPLKALSYDVEKNLRAPLKGIGGDISVAIRTGDTPQKERQAMLRKPPDVLITTPESLSHATSRAREFLVDTDSVSSDASHAVARTKRGVIGAYAGAPNIQAGRAGSASDCRHSAPARRWGAFWWAPAATARSWTPACASRST